MSETSQGRLVKGEGSYYTPPRIAEIILDIAGYKADNPNILGKTLVDPAAGDGSLLVEAIKRYILCSRKNNIPDDVVEREISTVFIAYEIDEDELAKARRNVALKAAELGISLDEADLVNFTCGNAFDLYKDDMASFDYVIGNPPYVRIHNMDEKPESKYIDGMCDLYYPFFDIGQQLLKDTGVMCYIAPSSWFSSKSGRLMRGDLEKRQVVASVCDFGHYQVFAPYATAYTAIIRIEKTEQDEITIYPVDADGNVGLAEKKQQEDCWANGLFMPGCPSWFEAALNATGKIRVLNGYATNLDRVYISKTQRFPGSIYELPIVKASRCEKHYMVYPYDKTGNLIAFSDIETNAPDVAAMLEADRDALLKRTQVPAKTWWQFGRSQGIADTFKDKVAVQSLVKPGEPVRVMDAPSGTGVYGGVYVLGMELDDVKSALNSSEFFEYASALRKYKSGGYYSLGGKDIEKFLNWWVSRQ